MFFQVLLIVCYLAVVSNSEINCSYDRKTHAIYGGDVSKLYLDLLRNTLTGLVYAGTQEKTLYHGLGSRNSLQKHPLQTTFRTCGNDLPYTGLTMVGLRRLEHIQLALKTVGERNVSGDFVECGVWHGGASAYAFAVLQVLRQESRSANIRNVWLADSFRGFGNPNFHQDSNTIGIPINIWERVEYTKVSLERVKKNLKALNLLNRNRLQFIEGFFSETLPSVSNEILSISVLRLDGDMYESTMDILYNLYGRISIGGWVIIDDWWMPTCREAIVEFRRRHRIYEPIKMIDNAAAYWVKLEVIVKVNGSEWFSLKKQGILGAEKTEESLLSLMFFGAVNIISFVLSSIFSCRRSTVMPFSVGQ